MLAALVEWILWLAAFCYCLCMVIKKTESWTTTIVAIVMMILFVSLRYVSIVA
jgi:chitin synthase